MRRLRDDRLGGAMRSFVAWSFSLGGVCCRTWHRLRRARRRDQLERDEAVSERDAASASKRRRRSRSFGWQRQWLPPAAMIARGSSLLPARKVNWEAA